MLPGGASRVAIVVALEFVLWQPAPGQTAASRMHGTGSTPPSVYLSGKVMLDDGTPPPDSIPIERVCSGVVRREAYTDGKGRFSFQAGQKSAGMQDSSAPSSTDQAVGPLDSGGLILTSNRGLNSVAGGLGRLADCDLRAFLPGYRSDVVSLANQRVSAKPDLGTIVLHRLANVSGAVVSRTALEAPPEVKQAYAKGRTALKKSKWDEAEKQMRAVVAAYPKHAAAWHDLGGLLERRNETKAAGEAYRRALAADPKFLSPYLPLAQLAAQGQHWQETADLTDQLIHLDPVDYVAAYYYNALANLRLSQLDAAERSAREAQRLDTENRLPKIDHVLGLILAKKGDYAGAAAELRAYLRLAPEDHDAVTAKTQLAELDQHIGGALGIWGRLTPSGQGYSVGLHIDPDHISLAEAGGNWTGQLELSIVAGGERQPGFKPLLVNLRFTPEVLERVKKSGLTLHRDVEVPAQASAVLVTVRDIPSGAIGSLTLPVPAR